MTTRSFTSRNEWFFAAADALPNALPSTHVLCERRVLDGAVVAEWNPVNGSGWMRSGDTCLDEAAEALPPASSLLSLSDEEVCAVVAASTPYYVDEKVEVRLAMPVLSDAAKIARAKAGKVRYYYVEVKRGAHRLCAITLGAKGGKVVALTTHNIMSGDYSGDWAEKAIIDKAVDWNDLESYPASSMPSWAKTYIDAAKAKTAGKKKTT